MVFIDKFMALAVLREQQKVLIGEFNVGKAHGAVYPEDASTLTVMKNVVNGPHALGAIRRSDVNHRKPRPLSVYTISTRSPY